MLTAAEIINQTGLPSILYLREGAGTSIGAVPGGTINLSYRTLLQPGTGEVIRLKANVQPQFSQSPLPFELLSTTTGSELQDLFFISLLVLLSVAIASVRTATDYHTTFEFKDWTQAKSHTKPIDQIRPQNTKSASIQTERLREISGLKAERLAEIFGVSRTTYHKWLSGSPLHDAHREHLFEVLSLVEEATQRLGSPSATNTWLLTPVSPEGNKPIDYLAKRQYSIFRGFLLHVHTGREAFRPLPPSNRVYQQRSREEVEDALERLSPRAWREEDDLVDASGRDG